MAFSHQAGVTDPEAPDEVVDWFSTFETWITGVGWTVASGSGTTDLFISSVGEAGGLTMLFVHIWRGSGADVNKVFLEVSDDAVAPLGTHHTTRGGYVDSGGVQFAFWMSADKDAIVIVFKAGAGYRMVYGGLVYPFALTVTDETYQSIATDGLASASILRRHDGLWDQDDLLYYNAAANYPRDRDDNSKAIFGTYFGDHADIAGQLKHISSEFTTAGINPEDTETTGQLAPATSEWICLQDHQPRTFFMRTGGVLPTGRPDGTFAHANGNAATIVAFYQALAAFMTANGWTAKDISAQTGKLALCDWEFNSAGEDGTEDIWVRLMSTPGGTESVGYVADSAYGTPGRHESGLQYIGMTGADFPTQYYFSGDKDCVILTWNDAMDYKPLWLGLMSVYAPNLSWTYMKASRMHRQNQGSLLLSHDGVTWAEPTSSISFGDGIQAQNSNPNNYDGTTYLVWPMNSFATAAGGEALGTHKYFFATSGGGVASLDTITVAGRVYTVFFNGAFCWAMRTV